jgi:transposase
MIRSSSHSIKFTNAKKLQEYRNFIEEYRTLVGKYVNILWTMKDNVPKYIDAKIIQSITTKVEFDARIRQCAATQASGMVRAVLAKRKKQLHKLKQLQREGKSTHYLQRKLDTTPVTKPNTSNINVELTARLNNRKDGDHFDEFVEITQIGNKRKFRIPINHTQVSRKWERLGKQVGSIRLCWNCIVLFYEVENKKCCGSKIVGADQGQTTCLSLSDKQVTKKNKDGHDLSTIQEILCRKKKGSKGFRRAQAHRKSYINWSLKQLNFENIKEVRLEKLCNLRKGKRSSRKLSHWTYTLIKDKLIMLSETKGFRVKEQDNKFRSQRCSSCGWVHKSNRKGKTFKCNHCGFTADSDLNAASNHEANLIEVPIVVCQQKLNRTTGFYWLNDEIVVGQEHTVPVPNKE